jgi:hypothetical protein
MSRSALPFSHPHQYRKFKGVAEQAGGPKIVPLYTTKNLEILFAKT